MNRHRWIEDLKTIVGLDQVFTGTSHAEIYSYDASLARGKPDVVVFPGNTPETAAVVHRASQAGVPFVSRGFGTNLSGGTVLTGGGLVICLARLNRILDIHPQRRSTTLQPGVTNLELQQALASRGFFYAPDPASQKVATLGGNVGENSGGPRCLKYGVTTNHILGLQFVLSDGEIVQMGHESLDPPGLDLRGAVVGSEGTFGIVTEMTVRILPLPETILTMLAVYDDVSAAAQSVSDIMAAGIVPATLEMMDSPVIQAVEDSHACGYPRDAAAVLIIEVEGPVVGLNDQAEAIHTICMRNSCRSIRRAKDNSERNRLWEGRRGAFGAVARLAPNYLVNDCSVPRTKLPEALKQIADIVGKYGFRHGNVFHAGDGNLHPLIFFDSRDPEQMTRVKQAGWEIMQACVNLGGTISGEHGIGIEKREAMHLIFSEADLALQRSVKSAFDPEGLLNPGKALPEPIKPGEKLLNPKKERVKAFCISDQSPAESRLMETIQQILSEKKSIKPLGRATCEDFGNLLSSPAIPIKGESLDQLVELDPDNQVVVVESGMPLKTVQAFLGEKGLWLPVRPPLALGEHSLGGLVALGACGPERLAYGAPRDLLLGLRFISAAGRLISTGGRVVKNVSGYDMTRLMTASAGTLGFITRLTCKVAALPERCTRLYFRGPLANCSTAASQLLASTLAPAHITATPTGDTSHDLTQSSWRMGVGFEGFAVTIDYQVEKSRELMAAAGLEAERVDDYNAVAGCFGDRYAALQPMAFHLRGQFPLGCLPDVVASMDLVTEKNSVHLDLGCGTLRAALDDLSDPGWKAICAIAAAKNAHVLLEKAPRAFKAAHDVFGPHRPEWRVMHRIKKALDPGGVFSPGQLPGRV